MDVRQIEIGFPVKAYGDEVALSIRRNDGVLQAIATIDLGPLRHGTFSGLDSVSEKEFDQLLVDVAHAAAAVLSARISGVRRLMEQARTIRSGLAE